jgi:hypothetical protein
LAQLTLNHNLPDLNLPSSFEILQNKKLEKTKHPHSFPYVPPAVIISPSAHSKDSSEASMFTVPMFPATTVLVECLITGFLNKPKCT